MQPVWPPSLRLLERVLPNSSINAVLRGGALPHEARLSVYDANDILGTVKLPQAPNAFFGYVPAPEDCAGYQIVVLAPNNSPESDFWLTQGAYRRQCAGHVRHIESPFILSLSRTRNPHVL